MANYVFETELTTNLNNRAVAQGGYVAEKFSAAHDVTSTTATKIRMRVNTTGAATFKVGFWWGSGATATLHSETSYTTTGATGNIWYEHLFATSIKPADFAGQAFELRVVKVSGAGAVNVSYNNRGYSVTGGSFVSATTMTASQVTVANSVAYFGILERDPIYQGFQSYSAGTYTTQTYGGVSRWYGLKFDAPWAFNKLEVVLSGNSGTGAVDLQLMHADGSSASNVRNIVLTGAGTTPTWYDIPLSGTLPAGTYYYRVQPTNGAIRMYSQAGSSGNSMYWDGGSLQDYGPTGIAWNYRILKDQDYVEVTPTGPAVKRWDGSQWVTASVKRWNGSQWVVPTSFTRY